MKFWNWGPTTIWHNIENVAFYFSKSLHPTRLLLLNSFGEAVHTLYTVYSVVYFKVTVKQLYPRAETN